MNAFWTTTLLVGLIGFGISHIPTEATGKEFFVSPRGSDWNAGTKAAPWKTIERARDHIRTINKDMSEDITVNLREGTYFLEKTLEFAPADSGSKGHNIIYTNYEDEVATISGGAVVTGWTQHEGNIYKAKLDRDTKLRQLWVNGARAFMAKTNLPISGQGFWGTNTIKGDEPWAINAGSTPDGLVFNTEDLGDYGNVGDIEMSYSHAGWRQYVFCLRELSLVDGKRVAKAQQPMGSMCFDCWNSPIQATGLFDMWNAYELLDSPGEFYYDRSAKTLYYYTHNTTDMSTATVIAPVIGKLVTIRGASKDDRVENLQFTELVFAHNHWPLMEVGGSYGNMAGQSVAVVMKYARKLLTYEKSRAAEYDWCDEQDVQPGAIEVENASGITFAKNTYQHLACIGVSLRNDVHDSEISSSRFVDIGSAAVNVGHVQHRWLDGGPLFPKGVEDACENILVTNNVLRDCGAETLMAPNITAFYVRSTEISHNDLHTTPYSGISLGWGWTAALPPTTPGGMYGFVQEMSDVMRHNRISYNRIDNYNHRFGDGGAIYTLGVQDSKKWSDIKGNFVYTGRGMGYYADEGSQYWNVKDCAIAGGAWLVCNPGTRDIRADNIYTGIGYEAGFKTDENRNIVVTNVNHQPWDPPAYTSPAGLAPIAAAAGVEIAHRSLVPKNLASDPAARASMSSVAKGAAQATVNGNTGDFYTHAATKAEANPWWQIDLGAVRNIGNVLIWNKWAGEPNASKNMRDFYVFVSGTPIEGRDPKEVAGRDNVWAQFFAGELQGGVLRSDFVRVRAKGRYVRIQLTGNEPLELQEVEIFENGAVVPVLD